MAEKTKFQGWTVLVCCFLIMFFVLGGIQTFAVTMPAIMKDTGFTLGQVALMSTIATVTAFLANMFFGALLKRLPAKIIVFIGCTFCVVNFLVISVAKTLFVMYFTSFLAGVALGLGTVAPISVIVNNWFVKNRSTYMSVVIAGSMFGGAIIMPLMGLMIYHFDWRVANKILAAATAIVTYTAIFGFLTDHPAKKGQKAYGSEEAPTSGPTEEITLQKERKPEPSGGVTMAEAKKTASFWLLLFGVLLIGCSTNVENFLPVYWRSVDMSVTRSSSVMGLYALLTGVFAILLGRVSDKLGGTFYILLTASCFILGVFLVYTAGAAATPLVILAIIPFAIGGKKTSTLTPPLVVAESFGRLHYGAIIGYFAGALQLGIAVSNPLIGALHKASGGYQLPFTVMGVLSVVGLILVLLALKKAPYKAPKKATA
ncbi:MAG: MFS transporter [Deltaproteobacteria bacterium]|nr:MFS transporter [Deltaproteobacteria bacterium]